MNETVSGIPDAVALQTPEAMRKRQAERTPAAKNAEIFRLALEAVRSGNIEGLKALLAEENALAASAGEDLWTLLHHAAAAGLDAMAAALLEAGANPDARDAEDRSPAQVAAEHGHNGLASDLIRAGGRLKEEAREAKPVNLLALAAYNGDTDTLARALRAGGNAMERDANGLTPLHYAALQGQLGAAKMLVKAGADVNAFVDHRNPLLLAEENRHMAVASYLLRQGSYQSAEQLAVNASIRIARVAVGKVALPAGEAALRSVCLNGQSRDVAALLAAGADPNGANEFGETPLHYAARLNRKDVVKRLLAAGADPERRDNLKRSALDYAGESNSRGAMKLLLKSARSAATAEPEAAPPASGAAPQPEAATA